MPVLLHHAQMFVKMESFVVQDFVLAILLILIEEGPDPLGTLIRSGYEALREVSHAIGRFTH